jgi:chromosome partitioning protein
MAVRKLLVASQKGGVGKTTTSINLAAAAARAGTRVLLVDADPLSNVSTALNLTNHSRRQTFRQAGADLPGVLYQGVISGLDVFSPYEEGGCSDDDFNELLGLLGTPAVEEGYGCMIMDSPPFMGANSAQLLGACGEYVLVMRTEPMAYRTLPAFLELVQRSRRSGHAITMRGILLTLPDGEASGGRWERELRGRFGGRILPTVIPHDAEVERARDRGEIISIANPDSPVALQYGVLIENLELAVEAGKANMEAESPLLVAAASLQPAGVSAATSSFALEMTPTRPDPAPETLESLAPLPTFVPEKEIEDLINTQEAEDLINTAPTVPPTTNFPPAPSTTDVETNFQPIPSTADLEKPEEPELFAPTNLPMPSMVLPVVPLPPRVPSARTQPPAGPNTAPERAAPSPDSPAKRSSPAKPSAPHQSGFDLKQTWFIWVGLAAIAGLASRSIELPDAFKPAAIGLAVSALVMLLVQIVMAIQENAARKGPAVTEARRGPRDSRTQLSVPVSKKEDSSTRLINLARYKRPPQRRNDGPS